MKQVSKEKTDICKDDEIYKCSYFDIDIYKNTYHPVVSFERINILLNKIIRKQKFKILLDETDK